MGRRLWIRHLIVAGVAGLFALLGSSGIFGQLNVARIDQQQVIVHPRTDKAIDITEVIDIDLASERDRVLRFPLIGDAGYLEHPTVQAINPPIGVQTAEIVEGDSGPSGLPMVQIGNSRHELVGQHRYEINYSKSDALGYTPFRIRVLPGSPLAIDRFRATIVGIELTDPTCHVEPSDAAAGCTIELVANGGYAVQLYDLDADTVVTVVGKPGRTYEAAIPAVAPIPPRREYRNQKLVGAWTGGAVVVGALLSFLWCRRRGANQVLVDGAGDASDVASVLAADSTDPHEPSARNGASVATVSDTRLLAMATTVGDPPPDIAPWEGMALLTERFVTADVMTAYLAGLAGAGAIEVAVAASGVVIGPGPNLDAATPDDRRNVEALLAIKSPYRVGTYIDKFARVQRDICDNLFRRLLSRGWWSRGTPRPRPSHWWLSWIPEPETRRLMAIVITIGSVLLLMVMHESAVVAVIAAGGMGIGVGLIAYRVLLPALTAAGSVLAVRTESFRRFLQNASPAEVERVHDREEIGEYSAWAVSLGELPAWTAAVYAAAPLAPSMVDESRGPTLIAETYQRSSSELLTDDFQRRWRGSNEPVGLQRHVRQQLSDEPKKRRQRRQRKKSA